MSKSRAKIIRDERRRAATTYLNSQSEGDYRAGDYAIADAVLAVAEELAELHDALIERSTLFPKRPPRKYRSSKKQNEIAEKPVVFKPFLMSSE